MSHSGYARPSPGSDGSRLPKQPRIFRACDHCVSAKTRCEEVTSSGCRLCRRRGRLCSLAGTMVPEWSLRDLDRDRDRDIDAHDRVGEDLRRRVEESEHRCAQTEKRCAVLEDQLHQLHAHLSALAGPAKPTAAVLNHNASGTAAPNHEFNFIIDPFPATWHLQFGEALFGISHPSASYPDVVARGVLSFEEVDMAFQTFKNRFTKLLPLRPYLLASTAISSHPFVILAVLHHVQRMYHPDFAGMLEESLLVAMSGVNNHDVVLALLILAIAPEPPLGPDRNRPTALRLIALAYQLGVGLGIDAVVASALQRSETLVEPFSAPEYDLVQLWAAVVNRYNILHMIHGRPSSLLSSIALNLAESTIDGAGPSTAHLRAEAQLVETARPVFEQLDKLENGLLPPAKGAPAFVERFRGLKDALLPYRNSDSHSIRLDALCIEFSHAFRTVCFIQNLPSPLQPLREAFMPCSSAFPPAMRSLVDLACNQTVPDRGTLPSYVTTSIGVAIVALRRTAVFVAKQYPDDRAYADIGKLRTAETFLRQVGGVPTKLLEYADQVIEALPEVAAQVETQAGELGLVPQSLVDMDFLSWDLSLFLGYYDSGTSLPS